MKRIVLFSAAVGAVCVAGATELIAPSPSHAPETRKHQGIPSVAVSKVNGRMWCTYYADPLGGENHLNYCILATSADDGKSWKEVLVADPDGDGLKRAFDPEVWVAPDGKLRWTWTERTLDPAKTDLKNAWNGYTNVGSDTLHVAELDAENEPTAPYPPVRALMRGVMMCKPTVVKSGDWVFPLCEWSGAPSSKFYATRDGRTFRYLGGITLPKDWRQFDEQQMVELSDGRWWALVRTSFGLCESYSSDQGVTWSEPVRSRLGHPNSRLFIAKLPNGKLLLVKHGKIGEEPEGGKRKVRKNLRAFVSSDDGRTWEGGLLLDARPGIAYPDGDVGTNGVITVVYDHNRMDEKEILLAQFTEADACSASDSSHRVELQHPVSRPKKVEKAE